MLLGGAAVMEEVKGPLSPLRFGVFELDVRAGELRKQGIKVKLQEQPFQILVLLLAHPGEVVTRDELRKKLWPADTFVDFDHGLNRAVNKLREALGDHSDSPRFIETLPRRGYRFVAPIHPPAASAGAHEAAAEPAAVVSKRRPSLSYGMLLLAAAGLFLALNPGGIRGRVLPSRSEVGIRSLAVLPLENLSNDRTQDYFADGMTDELTTEIAKIRSLRVTSRESAIQYKNAHKSLPVIARELGVDAIVTGAVVRTDKKVRITAHLIRASDDRHLWSDQFERDLTDVIALQGEVAQTIADHIQLKLVSGEHPAVAARPLNGQAYEAYLQGGYFRNKGSEENLNRSIQLFEKAIALDPWYAQAYAGLSETYIMLGIFGLRAPKDVYPKAKSAAARAVELDDTIAAAHHALADVKKGYDWDWPGAEAEYKRALMLNPSDVIAHSWYAELLSKIARYDEAVDEAGRARQLDPVSLGSNTVLGMVLYRAGRYDEAIEACRRALDLDPHHASALWFLALAHEQKGDLRQAISELTTAVSMSSAPLYRGLLGHAYGLAGDRTKALQMLENLTAASRTRYISPVDVALIHTGLGDRGSAFTWLEKAYQERTMRIQELGDPVFRSLRADPRFASLMKRVGLPMASLH